MGRLSSLILLVAVVACGGTELQTSETFEAQSSALSDPATAVAAACAGASRNHGQCVSCVTQELAALKKAGVITGREHGALLKELTQNDCQGCPAEGFMTCDGTGFLTCSQGAWVARQCAPGTVCRAGEAGSIICGWE